MPQEKTKQLIEELHGMVKAALADIKKIADQAVANVRAEIDNEDIDVQNAIDSGINLLQEATDTHQEKIADRALEIKDSIDPKQGDVVGDDLDFIASGVFITKELKSEERRIKEVADSE